MRLRRWCRGAAGVRGLTRAGPDAKLLAPTFQAAIRVAKAGQLASPPLPVPGPLRSVVRMAKLSTAALAAARTALDADEEFRERVALFVDEDEVGQAGVLFLTRPDGWKDELAALVDEALAAEQDGAAAHEERSARRKLKGAEEAVRRAERARDEANERADRATAELGDERRSRRAAEAAAAKAAARADAVEQERDAARRKLAEAEATVVALERELAAATSNAEGKVDALADAEARVAAAAAARAEAEARADLAEQAERTRTAAAGAAVAEAAAAAAALAGALGRAAEALGETAAGPSTDPASGSRVAETGPALEPIDSPRAASRPRRAPGTGRRSPSPLPLGVFDDSAEAAEHLLRANGVVVLVDGYNATIPAWPHLPIAEQRRRLVDALGELAVRTGADIHVVFDGVDDGGIVRADPGVRRAVRVQFSPQGVEADDVVLAIVDELPTHRPVVVASDDHRVRDGARARGANVLTGDQLFAVMRRER